MGWGETQKLIVERNLDIGRFRFYENITVGEIKEGVHVTFESAVLPLQIAEQIYGDHKPVVYISNRINSYSIDPIGYYEAIKLFPNLKAFAIVSNKRHRKMLASLEKLFMRKPIRVFDTVDEAFEWAAQLLENDGLHQKLST
ncbi:SpoIIAA family protein [Costertonia aggregata]|uniref:STAS/SEC14 domain-containing protein n=1 Tax=Costertonia aggregata TaxID=343403 RepID=A0A7H9ANW5_9FLAO|nr:STAS/SEC14 domain-containing protein [Costertonia aggregata]QLG45128.1 hypothetical protein HYG79_07115 [Costertonia aggregata]